MPKKLAFYTRSFGLYVREPAVRIVIDALHQVEEPLLDLRRDRTALSVADRDTVDAANRRHFRCRTREEDLVGGVQHLARHQRLAQREAHVAREADDAVTRDPVQQGAIERRRVKLPAMHDEEIL